MAKKINYRGSSLKRKEAFFVDYDTTNFLKEFDKRVEDFNGKGGAFERAVQRMIPLVKQDFTTFMNSHERSGTTIKSLMDEAELYWGDATWYKSVGKTTTGVKGFTGHDVKVDKTKNILFVQYGFELKKGESAGEAAIFLDIGRPGIKYKNGTVSKPMAPTFFVYYTIEKNLRKFNEIFKEEVLKELGGLL